MNTKSTIPIPWNEAAERRHIEAEDRASEREEKESYEPHRKPRNAFELGMMQALLGADHPDVIAGRQELAEALRRRRAEDEAFLARLQEAIRAHRAKSQVEHVFTPIDPSDSSEPLEPA